VVVVIFYYQLGGIAAAAVMQILLCSGARAFSKRDWPFYYLLLIVGSGCLLSLQAFFNAQWLNPFTLAVLGLLAVYGIRKNPPSTFRVSKKLSPEILIAGLMLFDLFYAALPIYRKDQWDYSLSISKMIFAAGPLHTPIYYDNLFFSGGYEFFIGLFRFIWSDDIFNHSAVNAFSWTSFIILALGMLRWVKEELDWSVPFPLTVSLLFFVAMQDQESILNAKPDPLLIFFALGCLALVRKMLLDKTPRYALLLGLCLAAPVAIKITWIQFIPPMLVLIGALLYLKKIWLPLPQFFAGAFLGSLLTIPLLYKNWFFFGNPIHPAQIAFLASVRWLPEIDAYWRGYTGRPALIAGYPHVYLENLWKLPLRAAWFALPVVFLLSMKNFRAKIVAGFKKIGRDELIMVGFVLLVTFIIWPKFFGPDIKARYVFPLYGIFLFITAAALRFVDRSRYVFVALLIPIILKGSYDVTAMRLARYSFASLDSAYAESPGPLNHGYLLRELNKLRAQQFPNAGYHEKLSLLDRPSGYLLDSDRIFMNQFDTDLEFAAHITAGGKPCMADFLRARDVRYVVEHRTPFAEWPEKFQPVIAILRDSGHPSGKVKELDHSLLEKLIADSATCSEKSN
jgi:hypothetical protein